MFQSWHFYWIYFQEFWRSQEKMMELQQHTNPVNSNCSSSSVQTETRIDFRVDLFISSFPSPGTSHNRHKWKAGSSNCDFLPKEIFHTQSIVLYIFTFKCISKMPRVSTLWYSLPQYNYWVDNFVKHPKLPSHQIISVMPSSHITPDTSLDKSNHRTEKG